MLGAFVIKLLLLLFDKFHQNLILVLDADVVKRNLQKLNVQAVKCRFQVLIEELRSFGALAETVCEMGLAAI